MAMERVPYLVGGGFEHSAEVMRAMLAASTSGAEGIVNAGDFKVRPLSVPGTSVRVAPGNALIRNSYGGGQAQTYACRAGSQTEVPIEATGSAGSRADLIVARIDDPTYQGGSFDPLTFEAARFEVIKGVPASQAGVAGLGLTYPAIALARINIPASTGTITSAMITDLRAVALPRSQRYLFTHGLASGEQDSLDYAVAGNPDGEAWPNIFWQAYIPEWAQRVRIRGFWGQVRVPGTGANNLGKLWVRIGTMPNGFSSQSVNWDNPVTGGVTRQTYMVAADRSVPAEFRGSTRQVYLRGSTDLDNSNVPRLDSVSAISLDLEFYETAV